MDLPKAACTLAADIYRCMYIAFRLIFGCPCYNSQETKNIYVNVTSLHIYRGIDGLGLNGANPTMHLLQDIAISFHVSNWWKTCVIQQTR
jgi:hypothetical protein